MPTPANTRRDAPAGRRWLVYGLIVLVWILFFGPLIIGQRQFAYRDTATLYYPLFEWIDRQWQHGEIPLWNPQENLGQALVGDGTSSVWYPGKLVFFARFVPYPARFALYVSLHVFLAAFGAMWCARVFQCDDWSASLAAMGYGFGAPVIFQTCNVVFLVGAAWLPWSLGCLWQFKKAAHWKTLALASITLSMMVLGGDPQIAYHVGLIAALAMIFGKVKYGSAAGEREMPILARLACLAALLGLSIGLSAVQVIPGWQAAQSSERTAFVNPRSLYEVAKSLGDPSRVGMQSMSQGIFGKPVEGTHHDAIYQFSFPPWEIAGAWWPNVFGHIDFVRDRRWSSQLPGADRLWVPSLYCGTLVFVFALSQFRLRRCRRPGGENMNPFLSWVLLISLLGSCGWFGIGWLANELLLLRGGAGFLDRVGAPVGGVYWLMVVLLPFYAAFRYPAKLAVIFALAYSLLAARGLDRLLKHDRPIDHLLRPRVMFVIVILAVVSFAGFMQILVVPEYGLAALANVFNAEIIDRIQLQAIGGSLLQFLGFLGLLITLVFAFQKRRARWLAPGFALFTVVDLMLAVWTLVPTVSSDTIFTASGQSRLSEARSKQPTITCVYRSHELDVGFAASPIDEKLGYHLQIDISNLRPKFHLLTDVRLIGSFSSVEPLDWFVWSYVALRQPSADLDQDALLGSIGTDAEMRPGKPIELLERHQPRFRLAESFQRLPMVNERDYWAVIKRTQRVVRAISDRPETVVLETDWVPTGEYLPEGELAAGTADIVIEQDRPTFTELAVRTQNPRLLVVADYFDANWQAFIGRPGESADRRVPILRANRIMRAIALPAGDSVVQFVYLPRGLFIGMAISGISWATLLVWFSWNASRRRRGEADENYRCGARTGR